MLKLRDPRKAEHFTVELAEGKATDGMMSKINALPGVLKPLKAEDVIVRGIRIANNQTFKDGRRQFKASALSELVKLGPGSKMIANHNEWGDGFDPRPIGRIFDSGLAREGYAGEEPPVIWVQDLFYMLNRSMGQEVAAAIDGGHVTEGSLGIAFKELDCSICDQPVDEWRGACANDHRPGATYDGKTCLWMIGAITKRIETSMLALDGMVDGTHFYLAAANETLEARDLDDVEKAYQEKKPSAWERLFGGAAAARAARREKFQSFLGRKSA